MKVSNQKPVKNHVLLNSQSPAKASPKVNQQSKSAGKTQQEPNIGSMQEIKLIKMSGEYSDKGGKKSQDR